MWQDAERRQVYYRHIGGATRGMYVVWSVEPVEAGAEVTIMHDLTLEVPVVRSWIGRQVTSRCFIHGVAGKTLRHMKLHVEAGA